MQPAVAAHATTISYSRAGRGRSDPADTPRTPENIVADLRRMLSNAGLRPPYVLVGHSGGALHMRVYAIEYPAEVAGLVLVDGAHERFALASGHVPRRPPGDSTDVDVQEFDGTQSIRTSGSLGVDGDLPDVPLAVLTATGRRDNAPPEMLRLWRSLHGDIFDQASHGMHVVTPTSGHFIQQDEPELVIEAIRFVIEASSRQGRGAGSP